MMDMERRTLRIAVAATVAAIAGPATAAVEAPPAPGFDVASLVGLGVKLLVVLVVILALAWLAKQMPMLRRSAGPVTILGGLSVGNRERIVLVEVYGERVLLGVTPGSVTMLHVLERKPVAVPAAEVDAQPVGLRPGFDFRAALADFHKAREDGGGPPHP